MKRYQKLNTTLLIILFTILNVAVFAQQSKLATIMGVVTNSEDIPVEGAAISAEEGTRVVITDENGNFKLETSMTDVLRIDAKGFEPLIISASDVTSGAKLRLKKNILFSGEADKVYIPFGQITKRQVVGATTVINPEELLRMDNQQDVLTALRGRVPGLFGTKSIRGLGEPLIVVDGIPRSSGIDGSPFNFIEDMNLNEIQQISVLKDAFSRLMYGAQADQGVILITTKRGAPYKRVINVYSEVGMKDPISYPEFMGAADFMRNYNQALQNDGLAPLYSNSQIEQTALGVDKTKYPDENFYNNTYLKDYLTYHRVATEASGGNDKAQYYSYAGWTKFNSLYALGEGKNAGSNQFNFRGNVDYQLNDWITATLDAVVVISSDRNPNGTNFWSAAATQLPNAYPTLIPLSEIGDATIAKSSKVIDGNYILGGTNQYRNNIYGNFVLGGYKILQQRTGQVNTGLKFDLGKFTKGLSASARLSYDMLNEYQISYNNQYAVFERSYDESDNLLVTKYGVDQRTNAQSLSNAAAERRLGVFSVIDYNRIFAEKHLVTATALGYWRNAKIMETFFSERNNHFGIRAHYMYDNRYIAELSGAYVGSGYLSPENRYDFAPSAGLGWIISEESFLSDNNWIDFLKLKVSFGSTKTDMRFPGYFLYNSTFTSGGSFNYNQRSGNGNKVRVFQNFGNTNLTLVSRDEINLGFEAQLLKNKLSVDANYFSSTSRGNIVKKTAVAPDYLGGLLAYENFEDYNDKGFEIGMGYQDRFGDFSYELGANFTYVVPKALVVNELFDEEAPFLLRQNKPYDAIFGYVAEGLFRDSTEIMAHPQQTFGSVRPGDIKYSDLNNDGLIDEKDRKEIGNSRSRTHYALHLNLSYKNWNLFALGTGQAGGEKIFDNSYYWISGNDTKYSVNAAESWRPGMSEAKYPRLTTGSGSNNYRTSTFWLEKNNWFTIHTVQFGYNHKTTSKSVVKGLNVYARGTNLATFSKIKDKLELTIGSTPQMRSYSIGVDLMF